MTETPAIIALDPEGLDARAEALGAILLACVENGASVSFMADLTLARAIAFWRATRASLERDSLAILVAEINGTPAGVVMVVRAGPDNQRHRGEIVKLLVDPAMRGKKVGRSLMAAAENKARDMGISLLVLDTETGSVAEQLYHKLGWHCAGTIPSFALDPKGTPRSTTMFYKELG